VVSGPHFFDVFVTGESNLEMSQWLVPEIKCGPSKTF
jgi:hypothetical protein